MDINLNLDFVCLLQKYILIVVVIYHIWFFKI